MRTYKPDTSRIQRDPAGAERQQNRAVCQYGNEAASGPALKVCVPHPDLIVPLIALCNQLSLRQPRNIRLTCIPLVTASVVWATALSVQEFGKGRGPVGFPPIGQAL